MSFNPNSNFLFTTAAVLKGLLGGAPVFWTAGIIEVITVAPMLGTGGHYPSISHAVYEAGA